MSQGFISIRSSSVKDRESRTILAPFAYYLYVKTDNPAPPSFRLVDKTCQYYTEDSYGEIRVRTSESSYSVKEVDPGTYYISQYLYKDVAFEDEATFRVPGGYIFRADASYSDGGEFVLLQKLLAEDGVIFASLDYHEQPVMRLIMDEVFGASNYVSEIACVNKPSGRSDDKYIANRKMGLCDRS